MKKLIYLLVFTSFCLTSCKSTLPVRALAKAGPSFASIGGDDAESFKGRTSFHAGVEAEVGVNDNFAVQPGLIYSSQGADYEDTYFSGSYKLSYLTVPVLAKFKLGSGFSALVGPQAGFLTSAKDEYDSEGGSGDEDVKDQTKGFDLSAALGLNYEFQSGLNFGVRYNLGLTELNDLENPGNESWKNGVLQFSIGYFFN